MEPCFPGLLPSGLRPSTVMPTSLRTNTSGDTRRGFGPLAEIWFLHRSVFEAQQFDQKYGRKGNELKFGEETFLQEHFLRQNVDTMVFYEPRIEVAHYVLSHKMSLSYHARRQMEMGACHIKMGAAAIPFEVTRVLLVMCLLAPYSISRPERVSVLAKLCV